VFFLGILLCSISGGDGPQEDDAKNKIKMMIILKEEDLAKYGYIKIICVSTSNSHSCSISRNLK
jgi:hypothetical protein